MPFRLTDHARQESARRQIPPDVLQTVLDRPEQIVSEREHRKAYQSRHRIGGKLFLVRAIVDDHQQPAVVITVYRTTKIDKYWSAP